MVLTVDVPVLGQRERDLRNGATIPPRITFRNPFESVRNLGWLVGMARHPRVDFVNVARPTDTRGPFALGPYVNSQFDPSVSWKDLDWFRSIWAGPLVLKGIMSAEGGWRAVEHGVDAIVVSNHGGRQLDGLPAAIEVLPEIADAVQGRTEILFVGGIRRGIDVIKALALGARACMIGRPYLYGLGAAGQAGVEHAINLLEMEIDRAQALLGRPALADLDRSSVRLATAWLRD